MISKESKMENKTPTTKAPVSKAAESAKTETKTTTSSTTTAAASTTASSAATKTTAAKAPAKKPAAKKPAAKKPAAKKPAAKKTTTTAAASTAKKAPAKKTTTKRGRKPGSKNKKVENVQETIVQFEGQDIVVAEQLVERVKEAYKNAGHRVGNINNLKIYINVEERKAYYVINNKSEENFFIDL